MRPPGFRGRIHTSMANSWTVTSNKLCQRDGMLRFWKPSRNCRPATTRRSDHLHLQRPSFMIWSAGRRSCQRAHGYPASSAYNSGQPPGVIHVQSCLTDEKRCASSGQSATQFCGNVSDGNCTAISRIRNDVGPHLSHNKGKPFNAFFYSCKCAKPSEQLSLRSKSMWTDFVKRLERIRRSLVVLNLCAKSFSVSFPDELSRAMVLVFTSLIKFWVHTVKWMRESQCIANPTTPRWHSNHFSY